MGSLGLDGIARRLNDVPEYVRLFRRTYGSQATAKNITRALEAYMLAQTTPNSTWIRYYDAEQGDAADPGRLSESGFSEKARAGIEVFRSAKCSRCHEGKLLTDFKYYNMGLGPTNPDPGRALYADNSDTCGIDQKQSCIGAFRNPSLIGVGSKRVFFHDGNVRSLREVVDVMLEGGDRRNPHIDGTLEKIDLEAEDKEKLIAFLNEL